jgi:putative FmdB family regulatory protein
MPIYDYACSACGHVVEVIHRIDDRGPNFCPECGAEGTMSKGFAAPAVHFKGSGWAKKDRTSASKSSSAKDDSSGRKETVAAGSGAGEESGKGAGTAKSTDGAPNAPTPATPSPSSSSSTSSSSSD